MVEIMPTPAEIMRANLQLPEAWRQNAVLLEFAKPIRRSMAGQFLRIQLTPMMLAGGEDEFYMVGLSQPHRAGLLKCRFCGETMAPVTDRDWRCGNQLCKLPDGRPTMTVLQCAGPARGVVKIVVSNECVDHVNTTQVIDRFEPGGKPVYRTHAVEWLRAVILLLDRRYDEPVLAAVKRTGGQICDMMGWTLR